RGSLPPLACPTCVVLLLAWGSALHERVGAGRTHPSMKSSTPYGFPEASRPDRGRSCHPRPAFPYWNGPVDTHEPGSWGRISALSNWSSGLVVGRMPCTFAAVHAVGKGCRR